MNARFYCALCQTGAEKAVKAEIQKALPSLRFAFSRPGFITFKEDLASDSPVYPGSLIFTRVWAEVIDQTREPSAIPALLEKIPPHAAIRLFDRDLWIPGEEPEGFAHDSNIRAILEGGRGISDETLRSAVSLSYERLDAPRTRTPAPLKNGDLVYSLVWVDDIHLFLIRYTFDARMIDAPGNLPCLASPPLVPPAHAPSRAWLKIEEAILRFKPAVNSGWTALEIGCAPGGATTALLDRGFSVTGIDPQFMDERVAANHSFTHVRKPARFATESDLKPCNPDWVVMDMSISPEEALAELAHVMKVLKLNHGKKLNIHRGFFTLKLNDWKFAQDIPRYLSLLNRMGFENLQAIQLASNRQELCVYSSKFRTD